MADIEPVIEVLENRVMRAWMNRDVSELRSLISSDCIFMFGTTPPILLDRPSFVVGVEERLACTGFRFHEVTARKYGASVWFSAHVELELQVAGKEWNAPFLITDLWRRGTVRRQWKLAERSLAPVKEDKAMFNTIRSMQLWR